MFRFGFALIKLIGALVIGAGALTISLISCLVPAGKPVKKARERTPQPTVKEVKRPGHWTDYDKNGLDNDIQQLEYATRKRA